MSSETNSRLAGNTSGRATGFWKQLFRLQSLRRWLPGVFLGIIILLVLLRLADWRNLIQKLLQVNPLYVVAGVLLTVISLGTRAQAWRALLGWKARFRQSFFIICEGYLLNTLLLLRAGEVARVVFMGQASGLGAMRVLPTIVLERAMDLAMAAGLLLATLPMALGMDWAKPVAVITLLVVLFGLIVLYLLARYAQQVKSWIGNIGRRWPVVEKRVIPRLDSLLEGLAVLTQPSQFFISFFWIVLSWVIWVATHFFLLRGIIDAGAPLWWAAFVDSVLAMGVAIPLAPVALGQFEAAIVGALILVGIEYETALIYAIVLHFIQFFTTVVLGLYGLIREEKALELFFQEMEARVRVS